MKLGPDGKIYLTSYGRDSLNAIHFPDRLGLACRFDSLAIPAPRSPSGFRVGMPNDLAFPIPDTIKTHKTFCFWNRDSLILEATQTTSGLSYQWQDSTRLKTSYTVFQPGTYSVSYSENTIAPCVWYLDTFTVIEPEVPDLEFSGSCPGMEQGAAWMVQPSGDTTTFLYTWKDSSGKTLKERPSNTGDTITGLNPGSYTVQIGLLNTDCDTAISFTIPSYAAPDPSFTLERAIVCLGDTLVVKNTSADPFVRWGWSMGDGTSSSAFSPKHLYGKTGDYEVTLVLETEKCIDSVSAFVSIRDFELFLSADKEMYNFGESILLQTSAAEPYRVNAWKPEVLFGNQSAYEQHLIADSNMAIWAFGASAHGCLDSAEVSISVATKLEMPSAFSPNGDGINDYFKPVATGGEYYISAFRIYDRWGRLIWTASGELAGRGWDGSYEGKAKAENGVYFYFITIETGGEMPQTFQGDVTLIR